MVHNHNPETAPKTNPDNTREEASAAKRLLRKGIVGGIGLAVAAGALAGCSDGDVKAESPSPTVTASEAPITTSTPNPTYTETKTPEPSPTETEILVVSPEMQAIVDQMEAESFSDFEKRSIQDRLLYRSSLFKGNSFELYMNKWSEFQFQPETAYPGRISELNSPEQVNAIISSTILSSFLSDSGAWDGYRSWDKERAKKIQYSVRLSIDNLKSTYNFMQEYEDTGEFYKMGQLGGGGIFFRSVVDSSSSFRDEEGNRCVGIDLIIVPGGMEIDTSKPEGTAYREACFYNYTDIYGRQTGDWMLTHESIDYWS